MGGASVLSSILAARIARDPRRCERGALLSAIGGAVGAAAVARRGHTSPLLPLSLVVLDLESGTPVEAIYR